MELILWRHAEAEEGAPDLARRLTPRGEREAARVAGWLRQYLPAGFRVVASPAQRAQQTAQALGVPFQTSPVLAPGAPPAAILAAAGWPGAHGCALLVGHQPDLGRAAALLVSGEARDWHIDKGGLWWIAADKRPFVKAVLSPDLL